MVIRSKDFDPGSLVKIRCSLLSCLIKFGIENATEKISGIL